MRLDWQWQRLGEMRGFGTSVMPCLNTKRYSTLHLLHCHAISGIVSFVCFVQDFFDLAIISMTRPQICERLAKLAAKSANVSQDAVMQQLSFPEGDPHPGSIISKVSMYQSIVSAFIAQHLTILE